MEKLRRVSPHSLEGDLGWQLRDAYSETIEEFQRSDLDTINPRNPKHVIMSDREPTRWQHNRIYPHPISPCVYTYDSRLYRCETVDTHCSNIIKSKRNHCCKS